MSDRLLASMGVLAAVNVVLLLAPGPVAGQAPTAAAKTTGAAGTPPRTPWGEPDLQAIWDFATITPMERPKEHAGKEVLKQRKPLSWKSKRPNVVWIALPEPATLVAIISSGSTREPRSYRPGERRL